MTVWYKVADGILPAVSRENLYDKWTSKPVLAVTRWGSMLVAVVERWEEDEPLEWCDTSRDHWNMEDSVTHWTELPEPPKN